MGCLDRITGVFGRTATRAGEVVAWAREEAEDAVDVAREAVAGDSDVEDVPART